MSAKRPVSVRNRALGIPVPEAKRLRSWIRHALAAERSGEVVLSVVTAEESATLNGRYRRREGATNVLAFPAGDPTTPEERELLPLGDLVVCAEVLEREAHEQGKTLEAHWAHVLTHGALHLVGYDHMTPAEAEAMESRERDLLAELGFTDPYA